ncbi:hypothetical protein [Motilibacter aurantiacus]|uniref:hypothetical protein n=1 Tax=Motilibacter aurantiacus TaxID=2714955 RepID=UPI00140BB275|nr:hypothetical protein [Motilibacter aurantiacus]NHC43965.1 hypothetical protein [Motilibacter aurantiacus]
MRRHDLDLAALVMGVVFLAVGVTYAAASLTDEEVRANVVVPAAIVGLGLAGIAAAIRAAVRAIRPGTAASETELPPRTD